MTAFLRRISTGLLRLAAARWRPYWMRRTGRCSTPTASRNWRRSPRSSATGGRLLFQQLGDTPAMIRALGGGATQFTINTGTAELAVHQMDVGIFVGDEWRVRPNFTLNLGLRYETQTNIHDWRDLAPRLAFAWAPGGGGQKRAKTVLRAGFGIFYDRFRARQHACCAALQRPRATATCGSESRFLPQRAGTRHTAGVSSHTGDPADQFANASALHPAVGRHRGAPVARQYHHGGDLYQFPRAAPLPLGRYQRAAARDVQSGSGEQRAVSTGPSRDRWS